MHPWRDRLHRWFAPAARRCPLSPDAITVIALCLNLTAAYLMYVRFFGIAIAVLTVGGLADAFDGIVAREQQKSTRFGDFLDHFCDRVSDVAVLAGWLFGNSVGPGITAATLVVVMLNGYAGTQIEATFRERRYDVTGRGEFVLLLVIYPAVSMLLFRLGLEQTLHGGLRIAEWMTMLLLASATLTLAQRLRLAATIESR